MSFFPVYLSDSSSLAIVSSTLRSPLSMLFLIIALIDWLSFFKDDIADYSRLAILFSITLLTFLHLRSPFIGNKIVSLTIAFAISYQNNIHYKVVIGELSAM